MYLQVTWSEKPVPTDAPPKFPSLLHVMLERVNAKSDAGIICSLGGAYRGQTF